VLPAARVLDGLAAPHTAGTREVEEPAGGRARAVLDEVVAVEHEGLDAREERHLAVQVTPAGLHHADLRVGDEVRDEGAEEVGLGDEVGVEDRDELALRDREARVERAGLVARAIDTVDVADVEPTFGELADVVDDEHAGLVGRVVEDLDLEQLTRVIERGDGVEEARGDGGLVVERELHRHRGEALGGRALRQRRDPGLHGAELLREAKARDDEVRPVEAVHRQEAQDGEVGDTQGDVHGRNQSTRPPGSCHGLVNRRTPLLRSVMAFRNDSKVLRM
jgi:hypothetical protein